MKLKEFLKVLDDENLEIVISFDNHCTTPFYKRKLDYSNAFYKGPLKDLKNYNVEDLLELETKETVVSYDKDERKKEAFIIMEDIEK